MNIVFLDEQLLPEKIKEKKNAPKKEIQRVH